jgi:hypothetical protein
VVSNNRVPHFWPVLPEVGTLTSPRAPRRCVHARLRPGGGEGISPGTEFTPPSNCTTAGISEHSGNQSPRPPQRTKHAGCPISRAPFAREVGTLTSPRSSAREATGRLLPRHIPAQYLTLTQNTDRITLLRTANKNKRRQGLSLTLLLSRFCPQLVAALGFLEIFP